MYYISASLMMAERVALLTDGKYLKPLGLLITAALSAYIVQYALGTYLPAGSGPPGLLANTHAHPFLLIHVLAGCAALLAGVVQITAPIRRRAPGLHRASGYLYVAATALSAPSALMLALGTTSGPIAGAGFAILALLTGGFTALGLAAALRRDLGAHRRWMLRSYAMTFAAITLRLMIPASFALGLDFLAAYRAIAWLCWMPNLLVIELWLRRGLEAPARPGALSA